MEGTIYDINVQRGMVAVLTEDGGFSVFELLGGDPIKKGDVVQWTDDTPLGSEMVTNITQEESYKVFFQNHCVPKDQLRQQLLY